MAIRNLQGISSRSRRKYQGTLCVCLSLCPILQEHWLKGIQIQVVNVVISVTLLVLQVSKVWKGNCKCLEEEPNVLGLLKSQSSSRGQCFAQCRSTYCGPEDTSSTVKLINEYFPPSARSCEELYLYRDQFDLENPLPFGHVMLNPDNESSTMVVR